MYGCPRFGEEIVQAVYDLYDFGRCERRDGTFYGTSGVCRKGSKAADKEKIEKAIRERDSVITMALKGDLSKKLSRALTETEKQAVNALPKIDPETLKLAKEKLRTETDKIYSQMKAGKVDPAMVDDFIRHRAFLGNPNTAKVITIGIEDTIPTGAKGSVLDKFYAEKFAYDRVKRSNPALGDALDRASAQDQAKYKVSIFAGDQSKLATTISGSVIGKNEVERGIGQTAQLELRAMPANKEATWDVGGTPWVKNSKALSEMIGTRKAYQEKYTDAMSDNLSQSIIRSAKVNPNLQTVILATSNEKVNNKIISSIEKNGGKTHNFIYIASGTPQIGRIVDIRGDGKSFLYDIGLSVSSRQFKNEKVSENSAHPMNSGGWANVGQKFVKERQRFLAGKGQSYDSIVKTRTNIQVANKLNAGKESGLGRIESFNPGVLGKMAKSDSLGQTQRNKLREEINRRKGVESPQSAPKQRALKIDKAPPKPKNDPIASARELLKIKMAQGMSRARAISEMRFYPANVLARL